MVGSRNGNGIDFIAHLLEKLAVILKSFRIGKFFALCIERVSVDIAKGDDIGTTAGRIIGVAIAFAPNADAGHVDTVVGAQHAAHKGKSHRGSAAGKGGALNKLTSR